MKPERKPKQGMFAIIPSEDGVLAEIPKQAGIHLVKHEKASEIYLASSDELTVSDAQLFKELRNSMISKWRHPISSLNFRVTPFRAQAPRNGISIIRPAPTKCRDPTLKFAKLGRHRWGRHRS